MWQDVTGYPENTIPMSKSSPQSNSLIWVLGVSCAHFLRRALLKENLPHWKEDLLEEIGIGQVSPEMYSQKKWVKIIGESLIDCVKWNWHLNCSKLVKMCIETGEDVLYFWSLWWMGKSKDILILPVSLFNGWVHGSKGDRGLFFIVTKNQAAGAFWLSQSSGIPSVGMRFGPPLRPSIWATHPAKRRPSAWGDVFDVKVPMDLAFCVWIMMIDGLGRCTIFSYPAW